MYEMYALINHILLTFINLYIYIYVQHVHE